MTAYQEYLRFIATLIAVLDPFLAVPIFLGVTASRDAASRQRLANAVVLTVFAVLAGAALFGEALLKLLGAGARRSRSAAAWCSCSWRSRC